MVVEDDLFVSLDGSQRNQEYQANKDDYIMVRLSDLPDPDRKDRKKFFLGIETRGKADTTVRSKIPAPKSKVSKASKIKGSERGRASRRKRSGKTRR